jgi:hypothetical protein
LKPPLRRRIEKKKLQKRKLALPRDVEWVRFSSFFIAADNFILDQDYFGAVFPLFSLLQAIGAKS